MNSLNFVFLKSIYFPFTFGVNFCWAENSGLQVYFFQHFKDLTPLSSSSDSFWKEFCYNSHTCSSICNVPFFLWLPSRFFSSFFVFSSLNTMCLDGFLLFLLFILFHIPWASICGVVSFLWKLSAIIFLFKYFSHFPFSFWDSSYTYTILFYIVHGCLMSGLLFSSLSFIFAFHSEEFLLTYL